MVCVVSRDTFAHVTRWLQELRENSSVTDKMVVILVGNKNDKEGRYVCQKPRFTNRQSTHTPPKRMNLSLSQLIPDDKSKTSSEICVLS